MVDTVLLKIPHPDFAVMKYELFTPNARGIFHEPYLPFNGQPFIKCINNPTKQDKEQGIYLPRLTVYKRVGRGGFGINLHIELSLPKLMYGNNFDELTDDDFEDLLAKLVKQLFLMGVMVRKETLRAAKVYAIHYSKNIPFVDYTTSSLILSYLMKVKVTQRMDVNFTDFRNEGEAARYYAKNHEFVCYDKIADLGKSKDRAIEKDDRKHNLQTDIFTAIRQQEIPIEVLRLELRLKSRKKMQHIYGKVGLAEDFTFGAMFKQSVAQTLLKYYWGIIFDELMSVLLQDMSFAEEFSFVARQRPQWKPQRVFAAIGLRRMILEEGHRKARRRFEKCGNGRTMDRVYKDIKDLDFKVLNRAKPFQHVSKALADFTPLRMKDFDLPAECNTL
ncbi:MAG: hypothetical protein PHX87_00790 [Candidatus Peribacteraceae bacterium]|nr:hypothetical protein [Candidatus Peribacteraceae bacterium]